MIDGFSPRPTRLQWNAIAVLAAAADALESWDDALAKDCLETAIKAWNGEKANPHRKRRAPAGTLVLPTMLRACWLPRRAWCLALKARVMVRLDQPHQLLGAYPAGKPLRHRVSVMATLASDKIGQQLCS